MSSAPSPLSYVYDDRECLGFILARGKLGFEAVDRDERSLGLFQTEREAVAGRHLMPLDGAQRPDWSSPNRRSND
jgi:hypothetical protein